MADEGDRLLYERACRIAELRELLEAAPLIFHDVDELDDAIPRRFQTQANAELDAAVDGILDEQPPRVFVLDVRCLDPNALSLRPGAVIPIPESPSSAELRVRDRILTHLEACLREAPFETGDGPLSLPAHEPCGFERARGALRLRELARAAIIPLCGVVGHAADCECATL